MRVVDEDMKVVDISVLGKGTCKTQDWFLQFTDGGVYGSLIICLS